MANNPGNDHIIATKLSDLEEIPPQGVTLITGEIEGGRTKPANQDIRKIAYAQNRRNFKFRDWSSLRWIASKIAQSTGKSRTANPEFADTVIVVAGLSVLGKPLTNDDVHRADIFSELSGSQINQPITADAITCMLKHPQGGLKTSHPPRAEFGLLKIKRTRPNCNPLAAAWPASYSITLT